jgi:hypothetical protein
VSQKRLDQKQFNFKKSVGYIEDSFTQVDNTVDSDWYLILRANKDTPCTAMVDITSLDENVDEETPLEEQYENFEYNLSPPVRRTPIPPPKRKLKTRFNSKPIIHGDTDSESDDEDEEPVPKKSTDKAKLYKYVFIGLLCLLIVIGGLWWSGYLFKIPFLSKFKPTTTPPPPVIPPQLQQQPQYVVPPPPMQIPRPQPLTAPQPISMYTEPQQYVPDPDFINEMRDLKIDI